MRVRLYLLIWFVMSLVAPSALAQDPLRQALTLLYKSFCDLVSDPRKWIPTLLAAIAAIAAALTRLDTICDWFRKHFLTKSTTSAADIQTIRPKLLRRLKNDVNTRLDTTLHHLVKLDLQIEDQRYRVGQPQINLVPEDTQPVNLLNRVFQLFQAPKSTATQLKPTQRIIEYFDRPDVQGKLLILGEPGSGKTTELLTLAQDWLKRAENDDTLPLPIIFELSAWDGQPIEQWLVAQIQDKYKPSPKTIANTLLDEEKVLPLLDGLDELGLVQQRKCIEAINQFMQEKPQMNLIVCCRREEYEQGEAELSQLNGAVYLKPLTITEIEASLRRWNRHRLWDNIKQQAELLDLTRTPLFLTMLVVAYQGQPIRTTHDLLSAYIKKKLHDPESQGTYPPGKAPPPEKTLHYLSWLATKLDAENQTEFLIERLQPTWLDSDRQRLWYGLINELIVGLTGSLTFGLIAGLIGGPTIGLLVGLLVGLGGLLVDGLLYRFDGRRIEFPEKLNWSWGRFLLAGQRAGRWGLFWSLLCGLLFGLVELIEGLISGRSGWLLAQRVGFIGLSSLSMGLFLGLFLGLFEGLISSMRLSEKEISQKEEPNEGVRQAGKNGLIIGLVWGIFWGLCGLLFGLMDGELPSGPIGPMRGAIAGILFGVVFGQGWGLMRVIPHCSLRFLLYRSGSSPWNYARFLDHAAKHRFIQRVGGRYRFMHDLLRKHFAAMTNEDIKRLAEG